MAFYSTVVLVVLFGGLHLGDMVAGTSPGTKKLQVVYAVNVGGGSHVDSHGIRYEKDSCNEGIVSDFGKRMDIFRAPTQDQNLYQTERYSQTSFGYDLPILQDGSYVLVLKFAEVYFQGPRQKVFNVVLNSVHEIVQDLDIYARVGSATAHEEIIPFHVSDHGKKLVVGTTSSTIRQRIRLEFVKGSSDNPKANAFYILKGNIEDVPQLEPLPQFDEDEEGDEDYIYSDEDEIQFRRSELGYESTRSAHTRGSKVRIQSGPSAMDPWELESIVTVYMPLFASVGVSVVSFYFVRLISKVLE